MASTIFDRSSGLVCWFICLISLSTSAKRALTSLRAAMNCVGLPLPLLEEAMSDL
jgi:hypothetical protein